MHLNYQQVVGWDTSLIDVGFLGSEQSVPTALRGLAFIGVKITTGAPAATAGHWAPSATVYNAVDANFYLMTGSTASPVWSVVESSNLAAATFAYNSDSTSGALSPIPAAKMVNAMLDRIPGASDATDVTDTAAHLIALLPGAIVGSTFEFVYRNRSTTAGQKMTLSGGTGVTFNGNTSIFANGDITFIGIVTNVGTPAVVLYTEAATGGLQPTVDVASSVNTLQVTTSATGNPVSDAAVGSDINIGRNVDAKGSGAITIGGVSTGLISLGRGSRSVSLTSTTVASLGTTQNSTPSAAQLLGGVVTQTGATGAGTVTLPIGTVLSAAIPGVATGDSFSCLFANLGGSQNLVITAGASGMTIVGNATVPTGKNAELVFVCTASNVWSVYVVVSA